MNLEDFRAKYLPELVKLFTPVSVFAFGSMVRGDSIEGSDLDLIVLSEKFRDMPWPERAHTVLDALKVVEAIDFFCYSPEELEKKRRRLGIVRTAMTEGVKVI